MNPFINKYDCITWYAIPHIFKNYAVVCKKKIQNYMMLLNHTLLYECEIILQYEHSLI